MAGRERLGARRKALGLTQESLAERLRVERSTVARWEQGTSTPRPWYRRRLAEALDLTPDELARMLCPLPESRAPAIDPGLASVPADARRLVELDTRYGGDDLLPLAVRATRAADERLTVGHRSAGDDVGLHSAVAELAQVAAWIAFDADEQRLSRRFTHEALVHSRLAGDRRVELLALAQLAMQSVHLGRPGEALRVADMVIDRGGIGPRVAAVFHLRRARALALMGDRAGAVGEHDRADGVLAAGSSRDPDWTWWVDQAELSWHRAMTLLCLGDRDAALDLFRTAYELRAPEARRSRFNDLAHLLAAQVSVGAWPDAAASLDRLTGEVDGIKSGRTDALLRRVVRRIGDRRPPAPSAATDAAEHLTRRLDRTP
jgi:transcriptional regulator with XRE-family HTH domain